MDIYQFKYMTIKLCVGTKKGAFILSSEDRSSWNLSDPILFGNIIYHFVPDPRDAQRMLIATRTGHLGPTIFRSNDGGKSWKEASEPPKFEEEGKSVNFIFWLTPGHPSQPDTWYAGTSPQGLFRSDDGGDNWSPVDEFNKNSMIKEITTDNAGTPIGPLLHSINVDPTDDQRMILAMSSGGCFETRDGGQSWKPFNENVLADFLPDPYPETGHCVHNLQLHPLKPNIIYQQGHCGVYRLNMDEGTKWARIGENIPDDIGDMGFPLILHPSDENKVWVVPMDGSDVWPRTSVDGKPALYHSKDGGQSWIRQDNGLPHQNAWFTVLRQATCHDYLDPLGLYVGNRGGEIWASSDEGSSWSPIVRYLPDIHSIEAVKP